MRFTFPYLTSRSMQARTRWAYSKSDLPSFYYILPHLICIFLRGNKKKVKSVLLLMQITLGYCFQAMFFLPVLWCKVLKTFYSLIYFGGYSTPPEARVLNTSFNVLIDRIHWNSREWEVRKFYNCSLSVFKICSFYKYRPLTWHTLECKKLLSTICKELMAPSFWSPHVKL